MVKTATVMARSARKKMLEPKMPKKRPMQERQVMVGGSWGWVLRFCLCPTAGGGLPVTYGLKWEAVGGVKSIDLGVDIDD